MELFYGPTYQEIEKVLNISASKLTLQCRANDLSESDQGQFPAGSFNPFAEDVLLQAMLVWVRKTMDAGSLPLKIEGGEFFEKIPFNELFYVSLDVRESSSHKLIADLVSHDQDGKIYTRLIGAEVTISKQLNDKFRK